MDRDTLKHVTQLSEKLNDLESILEEVEKCQKYSRDILGVNYVSQNGGESINLNILRAYSSRELGEMSGKILFVMQEYLKEKIEEINKELDEL